MAKAWPQAGGSAFLSSLDTKIQMTSTGPPDLELGTRLQGRHLLVFDRQSQAKQGRGCLGSGLASLWLP